MGRFNDDTVRLSADIYRELQRLLDYSLDRGALNLSKPSAPKAIELAGGLGLTGARLWMEQHPKQFGKRNRSRESALF